MTTAANSTVGNLWPGSDSRSIRPKSAGDVSISASSVDSYYPPGFGDGEPAPNVPPVLRAEQGSRSRSKRGASPFVRAGHKPGELPRRERSSRHTESDSRLVRGEAEEEPAWAREGEDMFGVFLDRFSRPISQASVRSQGSVTKQALGHKANSHDANESMASSLAASRRSRASAASRASRSSSSLGSNSAHSQYLAPQRSLPNLSSTTETLGSTKEIMSMDAAADAGSDDAQLDDSDARAEWNWEKASPRALRKKVVELERFQRHQDMDMAQLRREILQEKRLAVKRQTEESALHNEIARLGQHVQVLTESQVSKAAEIAEAVALATGEDRALRARGGLGKGKTANEFERLKGMYATTEELKSGKVKLTSSGGYDPWASTTVTTLDARDSMAEVLGSVKDFLSEVESEQFVNRRTREQANHFAHTLDLARLAGQVDEWQSQCLDSSWKPLPGHVISDIIKSKEQGRTQLDVELPKEDGRPGVSYHVDLANKRMHRNEERPLRSRERSDIERAAGLLSTIASVNLVLPTQPEDSIRKQRLQQIWKQVDVDGSGALDRNEVRQVMQM
jgi:hypothetical protein